MGFEPTTPGLKGLEFPNGILSSCCWCGWQARTILETACARGHQRFERSLLASTGAGAQYWQAEGWCSTVLASRGLAEHRVCNNGGRPRRSLCLETPRGSPARAGPPRACRIIARPVLGGLHHEYGWLAA